eukprot:1772955-Rhodomonas_salina.1
MSTESPTGSVGSQDPTEPPQNTEMATDQGPLPITKPAGTGHPSEGEPEAEAAMCQPSLLQLEVGQALGIKRVLRPCNGLKPLLQALGLHQILLADLAYRTPIEDRRPDGLGTEPAAPGLGRLPSFALAFQLLQQFGRARIVATWSSAQRQLPHVLRCRRTH